MYFFFFFNDTATTEIYTLSLHDALPICIHETLEIDVRDDGTETPRSGSDHVGRSEEYTSELQSRRDLVCRLLLEKKKKYDPSLRPNLLFLRLNRSVLVRFYTSSDPDPCT